MVRSLAIALLLLVPARAVAEPAPPPSPWRHHHGLTVDAGVGIGDVRGSLDPNLYGSQQGVAGPNLGVGWFVHQRVAVSLRLAGVYHRHFTGQWLNNTFVGPSAQVWLAPYAWVSVGAGVGRVRDVVIVPRTDFGFALDTRVGLVFNRGSRHSINVSVEWSPSFVRSFVFTGLGLVAGYQFL